MSRLSLAASVSSRKPRLSERGLAHVGEMRREGWKGAGEKLESLCASFDRTCCRARQRRCCVMALLLGGRLDVSARENTCQSGRPIDSGAVIDEVPGQGGDQGWLIGAPEGKTPAVLEARRTTAVAIPLLLPPPPPIRARSHLRQSAGLLNTPTNAMACFSHASEPQAAQNLHLLYSYVSKYLVALAV